MAASWVSAEMTALIDVIAAPWAILPDRLLQIQGIYQAHTRGELQDLAAIEKSLGRPLDNGHKPYTIDQGVAILPIEGVIAKRANMFHSISGGCSSELVARDLQAAIADPGVDSIILAIDSPGGTVDGVQVLSDAVLAARGIKPIVTHASGTMASAAYWIGSAAQAVYVADGTTMVGSIGVVATHTDVSGAEAQRGIKTTEIYAGKYKRIASSYAPLSDAGRESLQASLDYIYAQFVGAVAMHRGVGEQLVLANMADGRIFIGAQAIDAGLVDGIESLQHLVTRLSQASKALN